MSDSDPVLHANHIPTLSEAVCTSGSDSEKFSGPDLNHLFHNHIRPDTADAAVMAKRSTRQSRPNSAQQMLNRAISGQLGLNQVAAANHQPSVEEVLELTSQNSSAASANSSAHKSKKARNQEIQLMTKSVI